MRRLYVREWRQKRDLTQTELADQAGVRQQTVSDIELGYSDRPHRTTLRALATALRCKPEELSTKPKE
jgi:transcriptional regulator with XRE-family HTH domain